MVVLPIAPTLYIAEAEEWIASKASLLNLRLVAIANLHPILSCSSWFRRPAAWPMEAFPSWHRELAGATKVRKASTLRNCGRNML